MSRLVGNMYNPNTMQVEKIYEGFSWPCLFFGSIWYIFKGMWKWTLLSFLIAVITGGISWFIFPFFNNKQYIQHLIDNGYVPDEDTRKYLLLHGLINEHYPKMEDLSEKQKDSSEEKQLEAQIPAENTSEELPITPKFKKTVAAENTFCPYCGTVLKPGFQFCPNCGSKIELTVQEEEPQAEAIPADGESEKKNPDVEDTEGITQKESSTTAKEVEKTEEHTTETKQSNIFFILLLVGGIIIAVAAFGINSFTTQPQTDIAPDNQYAETSQAGVNPRALADKYIPGMKKEDIDYLNIKLDKPLLDDPSQSLRSIVKRALVESKITETIGWYAARVSDLMAKYYGVTMPHSFGDTRLVGFFFANPESDLLEWYTFVVFPNGFVKPPAPGIESVVVSWEFVGRLLLADSLKDSEYLPDTINSKWDWRNGADGKLSGTNVNLRAGPSLDYDVITTMQGDERFLSITNINQGEWCYVATSTGYFGWVYGQYYQPVTPSTKRIGRSTLYRFGDTPKAVMNELGTPHNLSESDWNYVGMNSCYIKYIEYHYEDVSFYFTAFSDRPTHDLNSHEVNICLGALEFHTSHYEILGFKVGDIGINSVLQKMEPYFWFYENGYGKEFLEFHDHNHPDNTHTGVTFFFDQHETIKSIKAWAIVQ